MNGRIAFVLCIVFVLYILSIQNPSSFYILLKNLIKAIKEGRISKAIGRAIVRRLKKKGIAIDPELLEYCEFLKFNITRQRILSPSCLPISPHSQN
jgi:hypothetical protein